MAPRIRMVCSLLALLTSACFVTDTAGRNSSPRPAPTRPSAVAAPGSLDAAFGDGGRVISGWDGPVDVPYWDIEKAVYGHAFDVEIQNDGRILVIGARGYGDAFASLATTPTGALIRASGTRASCTPRSQTPPRRSTEPSRKTARSSPWAPRARVFTLLDGARLPVVPVWRSPSRATGRTAISIRRSGRRARS